MPHTLYIVRGIPGAGKSTLAKALVGPRGSVFSEDDYWEHKDGSYTFSPKTRERAFESMFESARYAAMRGQRTIALATAATDIETPEWHAFLRFMSERGYRAFPLILQRNTNNLPSRHHVSESEMDRFRSEMEHELEVTI